MQEIFDFLKNDLEKLDKEIVDFSSSKSDLTKEIANYVINSGGKRIRPILLILCAKICSEKSNNFHNLAAAIELIHTATLLHDDVVDNSNLRRGKETANYIWGNKTSILVGDFIFSLAFQLMVKSNNLQVLELLSTTSSIIADGEIMQLENSNNIDISIEKYFEIIFSKTAILFSAACEAPAILYAKNEKEKLALKNFGKNLGIIFQIIDDILDYEGLNQDFGKKIGADFFEGKITIPAIISYQNANENDKKIIENLFQKNLESDEKSAIDLKKITDIFQKYNAIEKSYEMAISYKNQALKDLEIFENSIYKKYLIDILQYSFLRKK